MENTDKKNKGQIQIADDVIASIAGTAALETEGIVLLTGGSAIIDKLSKNNSRSRNHGRGVSIDVQDKTVSVEINVSVAYGCSIPEVAVEAQSKVKDAIETMTGLKVACVNVNVAAIEFEKSEATDNE